MAILATTGIVAARVNTTEASSRLHMEQRGVLLQDGIDPQQSESAGKPFVGIALTSVPEDSDTGGALIVRVVEGSAADGSLQADDIITAIDGESVEGPRDVVRIVRERSPGDAIVFGIVRDGASMDVSITVGERDELEREDDRGKGGKHGYGFFGKVAESFVLSDTRYLTDDGVKTVRKAVGTAQNIDAGAGTFDLLLRDDSETLSFTIGDDTKIATDTVEGEVTIADLSGEVTTMVIEVTHPDGARQVQLVAQGEFSVMMHSMLRRDGIDKMPRIKHQDSDGFSPRRFFFRWGDNDSERRGRGHD